MIKMDLLFFLFLTKYHMISICVVNNINHEQFFLVMTRMMHTIKKKKLAHTVTKIGL